MMKPSPHRKSSILQQHPQRPCWVVCSHDYNKTKMHCTVKIFSSYPCHCHYATVSLSSSTYPSILHQPAVGSTGKQLCLKASPNACNDDPLTKMHMDWINANIQHRLTPLKKFNWEVMSCYDKPLWKRILYHQMALQIFSHLLCLFCSSFFHKNVMHLVQMKRGSCR